MSNSSELLSRITANDPHPESIRDRHLLQAALRRWSVSRQSSALVLRGGLLTQLWVGPARRATRDLDFLGLFPLDIDDTLGRLEASFRTPVASDGVVFMNDSLVGEVIWQETKFPGLRFRIDAQVLGDTSTLQIDVGFGDPLIPPAVVLDYPCLLGDSVSIQAVRPELLVAWKLDGLLDNGPKRWQAKDLYDLHLLTSHCPIEQPILTEAIVTALAAHENPLEGVKTILYDPSWWQSASAQARWARFRAGSALAIPGDLNGVAAAVAKALRPALGKLLELPVGDE